MVKFCGFVAYKYQDIISYERIISFLKENYNFYPTLIHTDYEFPLYKAFDNKTIYEKGVIYVFCFFHYIKAIKEKMKSLKLPQKPLKLKTYEILKTLKYYHLLSKKN